MANGKEERIAVAKMLVNIDDEGSGKLDHFKIYSRQEAIERMAKALCADDVMREGYYQMAEAALNALLEGK